MPHLPCHASRPENLPKQAPRQVALGQFASVNRATKPLQCVLRYSSTAKRSVEGEDAQPSTFSYTQPSRWKGSRTSVGAIGVYCGVTDGLSLDLALRGRVYRLIMARDGLLIGEVAKQSGASRKANQPSGSST